MWYPGGDNWDLLRVQISTESAIPFRGVLWVELDLQSHWRRQRDDYRIERAVYVSQEASQLFDVLLPAQATFLGATLRAEGAPEDAKPACAIDAPSSHPRYGRREISEIPTSWITVTDQDSEEFDIAFSTASGTMRSLPTSIHYLADCDGIIVFGRRELPAETITLLADAVKAGATLITSAPTLESSCPALLAKLFGVGYDAEAFLEDQDFQQQLSIIDEVPYFRTVEGRVITPHMSRYFIQVVYGTGGRLHIEESNELNNNEANESNDDETRESRAQHHRVGDIAYAIGSGLVILVDNANTQPKDVCEGLESFEPMPDLPSVLTGAGMLVPVANLAQEYVFGPMAVTFLLLLYVALAGPVLFFVLRKRAPALLVPMGIVFCLVAVILIFIGINVRRALAPDAIVIDVTVFGADGVPAKVHSIMSAGNIDLRRPNSHAITPIGDNTRLRPLVLSVTPAEQSVKDSGLGEWQATNLVIDAPPAKDQQPLSLTLRSDGSFVSSADLKFALISNVASDVTAFDETSSGVCLLHDIKAGTPLKFSPMSPKELSGVIDTMDDEYQELFRRILYAGEYGNGSVIAIPADPGFLKPPHSDTFDVRRAAIAWLPLVREAPAREQP
ncbi:MAG: hypothetical protein HUU29_03130 [Planctomycetaceae bacterium]|nr:hypothetical protein [Planctomycetaceae bacterium]